MDGYTNADAFQLITIIFSCLEIWRMKKVQVLKTAFLFLPNFAINNELDHSPFIRLTSQFNTCMNMDASSKFYNGW